MTEVTLKRFFKADIAKVFAYVSETDKLLEWWGPESMSVPIHNLDFSQKGAWFSEMHNAKGEVYKVSGHVTRVDPPKLIGFTWGWHGENDARGHESHVMIELTEKDGGTEFVLTHSDLPDPESAGNHKDGWTSSITKLERIF